MRMVVLEKRPARSGDRILAGVGDDPGDRDEQPPWLVKVYDDLSPDDVADLRQAENVLGLAPPMKVRLVRPTRLAAARAPAERHATEVAWGVEAVGASTSHRKGRGVKVAVLDTGIERDHPAFEGLKLDSENLRNFTGEGPSDDVTDEDEDRHGTHCAATIFGRDVQGVRIGVAKGISDVLIAKVVGRDGATVEAVAEALQWAYAKKAHILSMSLGIDFHSHRRALLKAKVPAPQATSQALADYGACVRLFDRMCQYVADEARTLRSMLVVAAAGNESARPRYAVSAAPPANAWGVVTVGAVGRRGDRANGPLEVAPFSNSGVHFCAPGVRVLSAGRGRSLVEMDGTSMAAPHVAGLAALWAEGPLRTSGGVLARDELLAALRQSARRLPHLGSDEVGQGLAVAPP